MRGYQVSQNAATEAAHNGIEVWISQSQGFFIRSDNAEEAIPNDSFLCIIGIHIDPLEMGIAELSELMAISYNTLVKAAREGRIKARQTGSIWLSTERSIKEAIEAGKLRPRK